jgi:iron complex outermembrane receptor protein
MMKNKTSKRAAGTKLGVGIALCLLANAAMSPVWADPATAAGKTLTQEQAQRRKQLLEQMDKIQRELDAIEPSSAAPAAATVRAETKPAQPNKEAVLDTVVVEDGLLTASTAPKLAGRATSRVERDQISETRAFSIKEMLEETPGVYVSQGNGPRDQGISIRGSGAKQGFGIRNIKVYDDDFPVTQSDGLARSDLNDPRAYESIDIIRGPSSSLHGNYALGGAANFRTRRGRDIHGFEVNNDFGSFGYHNHSVNFGERWDRFEYSAFASYIGGDGYIDWSDYRTVTQNILASFMPDEDRKFTFKFINNDTQANVQSRLTRNQYNAKPFCAGTTAITGLTFSGVDPCTGLATNQVSAQQTNQNREDRRTIIGARYEQKLTAETSVNFFGIYDLKDINQTFGTIGDNENSNFSTGLDVINTHSLFGLAAKHLAGFYFNYMEQEASSFRNLADYYGTRGLLDSGTRGNITNIGGKLREEIEFAKHWSGVLGIAAEGSNVHAQVRTLKTGSTSVYNYLDVDRDFLNVAPEAAVVYTPNDRWSHHIRVGTGYGIPGISNLTTTPQGVAGNNTDLNTQTNVGVEIGTNAHPLDALDFSLTGYYEFFQDELVSQSPGAGLSNFTTNAPASEHRGIEAAMKVRPFQGWNNGLEGSYIAAAYTFNDHIYTDFVERLSAGTTSQAFDRSGNQIPGVERNRLNAKLGYESPINLGGWLEVNYQDSFYLNNSNTLKMPNFTVLNLNLHYKYNVNGNYLKGLEVFFDIHNLLDHRYIDSGVVVADALTDNAAALLNKQAFFAAAPRSFTGGIKLKF